jgi:putative two-component system response regulator
MFKSRSDQTYQEITEIVIRLAYLAELKEWDNRNHLERVRNFSLVLASALGLSKNEATIFSIASQLHDIGKAFIPDELQKRSGNYSPEEWKIIEKHTVQGAKILESSASPVLQTASVIALTHHERWDGSGYPNKFKGEEIPLSGRIYAVVDVFDALTSKRAYKNVISDEEALKLIKNSSGVLFDPQIVKAFEMQFKELTKIKSALK